MARIGSRAYLRAPVLMLATSLVMAGVATGFAARPVLADCPVGVETCVNLDPLVGPVGTVITATAMQLPCDISKPVIVDFLLSNGGGVAGSSPMTDFESQGEAFGGRFRIPAVTAGPGDYGLAVRCVETESTDGSETRVVWDATITVTIGPPVTSTSPRPTPPTWPAVVLGLISFAAAFVLWPLAARSRG